ncbi:MAG: cytochrome b/b6 domain-containing protein [Mesorhizobium sp.]|nr:cytochrome b/b6 domain-containing protein [Mesorhizobium sp.]MCO5161391.1 cytochrome b/b6 domain-containing protein [Mesorhizobium sp.]
MATAGKVTGYSTSQVVLHWAVVILVAFQFVAHEAIEKTWRAAVRGEPSPVEEEAMAYLHIAAGVLIFFLATLRIYLRLTRGAPAPPADEPWLLKISGEAVHMLIYVLLFLLPLTGLIAWFLGMQAAGYVHEVLQNLLLAMIALHVAGALFQHFVRRSQVLMRMFRPQRD